MYIPLVYNKSEEILFGRVKHLVIGKHERINEKKVEHRGIRLSHNGLKFVWKFYLYDN